MGEFLRRSTPGEPLSDSTTYDIQIENIRAKLNGEIPLNDAQRDRLLDQLSILLMKKVNGPDTKVDLGRMVVDTQMEYLQTGSKEAKARMERLQRRFNQAAIDLAKTQNI